jgi:putative addiction module killer protein
MLTVLLTEEFQTWLQRLRDRKAQVRIAARIRRAEFGHFGDCKPVGDGISEMRVDFGPGYRLYFLRRGNVMIVMLAGGDKSSQHRDIRRAQRLAKELEFES